MHSNHPLSSDQARRKVRRLNAAQSAAKLAGEAILSHRRHSIDHQSVPGVDGLRAQPPVFKSVRGSCAPAGISCSVTAVQAQDFLRHHPTLRQSVQQASPALAMPCRFATPWPNWSLERTSTGMALGPRGSVVHHPPHGPSAMPAAAAQLKR